MVTRFYHTVEETSTPSVHDGIHRPLCLLHETFSPVEGTGNELIFGHECLIHDRLFHHVETVMRIAWVRTDPLGVKVKPT